MKDGLQNPKPEIRNPKEARNPKSESDTYAVSWGDDQEDSGLVLHEDGSVEKHALRALDERTAQFGESIIRFAKKIPRNPVNDRLISQLIGSGTSIGANYCEADNSVSGKDFKLKVGTCRKESKEAMFFLRMIASAEPTLAGEARILWREAKELNLIFGAIWRK